MTRNDHDESLLTWGPLQAAAEVSEQHHRHRFLLLREHFSSPTACLVMPTPHHKILCGGVIIHGRTVVLSSYPDAGADESAWVEGDDHATEKGDDSGACEVDMQHTGGGVQRWVVHHMPLTPAAKVEAIVVAVYDPDNLLDVRVRRSTWGQLPRRTREEQLYKWDMGQSESSLRTERRTQHHLSMLVAQVSCAKVDENNSERSVEGACSNQWMLVGGGFASEHPVVACGPEWRRVWRVAAPPHDALASFSISIRMSSAYLCSRTKGGPQPVVVKLSRNSSIAFDEGPFSGPPSPLGETQRHPCPVDSGHLSGSDDGSITFDEHHIPEHLNHSRQEEPHLVRVQDFAGVAVLPPALRPMQRQPTPLKALIQLSLGDARTSASHDGVGGEWSITLPEPFGVMCVLFRGCPHQDPVVLHALRTAALRAAAQPQVRGTDSSITPRRRPYVPKSISPLCRVDGNQKGATPTSKVGKRVLWQK